MLQQTLENQFPFCLFLLFLTHFHFNFSGKVSITSVNNFYFSGNWCFMEKFKFLTNIVNMFTNLNNIHLWNSIKHIFIVLKISKQKKCFQVRWKTHYCIFRLCLISILSVFLTRHKVNVITKMIYNENVMNNIKGRLIIKYYEL